MMKRFGRPSSIRTVDLDECVNGENNPFMISDLP